MVTRAHNKSTWPRPRWSRVSPWSPPGRAGLPASCSTKCRVRETHRVSRFQGAGGPRGYLPVGEEKMTVSVEDASLAQDIRKWDPKLLSSMDHGLLPRNTSSFRSGRSRRY
ncbi:hypothetical protein EJB05_02354, partial [Eragrostis curvula]